MSQLKAIGEYLIDIHGQNDNQSLLRNQVRLSTWISFQAMNFLRKRKNTSSFWPGSGKWTERFQN